MTVILRVRTLPRGVCASHTLSLLCCSHFPFWLHFTCLLRTTSLPRFWWWVPVHERADVYAVSFPPFFPSKITYMSHCFVLYFFFFTLHTSLEISFILFFFFFSFYGSIVLCYVVVPELPTYCPVYGHLGCSQYFAGTNSAAKKINLVQVYFLCIVM